MRPPHVTAAALVLLALVAPSCAADPAPVTACTPGAQVSCGCPGGSIGAQVCSADGARFGPCMCSAADAGADAGAGADVGAGVDAVGLDGAAGADVAALEGGAAGDAAPDAPDGGAGRCPGGLAMCRGVCITLSNDRENCGACGAVCPDGWVCVPSRAAPVFGECVAPDAGAGADAGG